MQFNQIDRDALYNTWMSQKAKMRLTQMEMAKKMGMTQAEFSAILRGNAPISLEFIHQFCTKLHIEPYRVVPSLQRASQSVQQLVTLKSTMSVDGEIQRVYAQGNQVIVEYVHTVA
ncbi:helix-turn-helix domain-containing protein [Vibrio genomosp. F10]|uniref:L-threonine 3-dehydrogenase n=1 Tax=Vibrio genomosp. F10 TaxID=723171 RepID=A0A1B9QYT6_9VIBR|nr:helix-turn-helix transcriptional regulator [Vibrio genomosp. F10]OCH75887.1 L-threonine 3-dehydrogenase [Vibrio genomosp. F10]OEE98040.1 L-threonine 3-dehydrogenase [Vibrio genomosp. F10 str. 9ZC157]OEF05311.1 L-threonine 3-dehydrogenase [Vibrio genomosp. F10 str. 9ZB36]